MSDTKKSLDEAELIRMQISENTGASLVSSVLNGKNYLSWSKAMRIALGAKMKMEYIDGETILTATYIINRLPSVVLKWQTPYEKLYKKPVTYSNMRVFGCLCHATNTQPLKSKFDPRAIKCVFIGYAHGQKGYKLFDIENKVTLASRDVVFYENEFPYKQALVEPTYCTVPLPLSEHSEDVFLDTDILKESKDDHHSDNIVSVPTLRKSNRTTTKPAWMLDFICSFSESHDGNAISSISDAYTSFAASISPFQEPFSYEEAASKPEWNKAMQSEIEALENNHTWDVTPLPSDKKPIGCRWIFKIKFNADGSIDRHKVRLVAKGYNQVEGIDYLESFSPVVKVVSVRLLIALAASASWELHQLDVNNAILHGNLDEEIYMEPPKGYVVPTGHVCKLRKSIYGLKQASRQWNCEFTSKQKSFGFVQSKNDYCLFTKTSPQGFLALLVYVDDILLAGTSSALIDEVKYYLDSLFTIKDLGPARYFLGVEIARASEGITLTQTKYISDIIKDLKLTEARTTNTPLPPGIKLNYASDKVISHPAVYRRLVGRLLYLNFTRPDISHAVQQLSQYLQVPCKSHMDAATHVVRYLKGTTHKGLFFPANANCDIIAYCDADWASYPDSRRSLIGYCVFLGKGLISWKTKKQNTVSRSTAEAEYRRMGSTACELVWFVSLVKDLGFQVPRPIPFYCDNRAALHIISNPVFHERTKHLEIDCHLVRDHYQSGFLAPTFVRSKDQLADIFTKALTGPLFHALLGKLGLIDFIVSPA
ncbi:UNVERIFIED_CONTAM: Retrovirus-related Pol polyprotein from transposon RE1 [Sesamum indicum]